MKQIIKDLFFVFLKYFTLYFFIYLVLIFLLATVSLPLYIKDTILELMTPLYGIVFVMIRMKRKKMDISLMKPKKSYTKECWIDTGAVLGLDIGFTWAASLLLGLFITVESNIDMEFLNDHFLISLLTHGILVPIDEEFFFRGYLMGELEHHDRYKAAIVISVVFGLAHLNPLLAVAGFVISMCMFALRFKYHSVWPGVLVHMAFNILNETNAYLNTEYLNAVDIIMIALILFAGVFLFKKKGTLITGFKDLFKNQEKKSENKEMCSTC